MNSTVATLEIRVPGRYHHLYLKWDIHKGFIVKKDPVEDISFSWGSSTCSYTPES